jgi:hypothetical protein
MPGTSPDSLADTAVGPDGCVVPLVAVMKLVADLIKGRPDPPIGPPD